MTDNHVAAAHIAERKEQPFLYPWNRRLRHVHGVSLRNLNLTPPSSRARGKTITDDEYNLKTTAKALIQQESRLLHHAKSFDNLPKATLSVPDGIQHAKTANEKTANAARRPGTKRRRSTFHWSSTNPRAQQAKLEDIEAGRLLTTWFSIHHRDMDEPIYISEVAERAMNPTFTFFDLDESIAQALRSDHFVVKVWSKTSTMEDYKLLIDLQVSLRSLQFIGHSLETFHHPLPENCVLFHLSDGIYTSFTDLPMEKEQLPPLTQAMKAATPVNTSSFDALMKLANLEECIQDALDTRRKLEADINALLAHADHHEHPSSRTSRQRERTRSVRSARQAEKRQVEQLQHAKAELKQSLEKRRLLIKQSASAQEASSARTAQAKQMASKIRKDIDSTTDLATGQIRRISAALLHVYPIEPVKNRTLQFTIRNIHLPHSAYDDTNRDAIAAALGFTAQLVYQLSLYLSVPLLYPIDISGPSPTLRDDVSIALAQREFPLHPGSVSYKFEYAVFLLNKNIEFLMNRSGLRVLDIRQTLPNLKYLLFVLTAGSGELPTRKAGGIRGLLRGRATPSISRRGSEDSVRSQAGSVLSNGSAMPEKPLASVEVFQNALRAKGLPYRKSMLRDTGQTPH